MTYVTACVVQHASIKGGARTQCVNAPAINATMHHI